MRIMFYTLYGVFGLLGTYFFLSSIVGHYAIEPLPQSISKLLLLVGSGAGGYLFYRAYLVGEVEGRYPAGAGLVLLAVVAFQAVHVAGMLAGGMLKKLE